MNKENSYKITYTILIPQLVINQLTHYNLKSMYINAVHESHISFEKLSCKYIVNF